MEPSLRYSDNDLAEFSTLIEEKLNETRNQMALLMEQINSLVESEEAKIKSLNDGIATTETEQLNSRAIRLRKHIRHLENAQLRIMNKTYGICRETGKLISKARLKAVPHATLSIAAKQSQKD